MVKWLLECWHPTNPLHLAGLMMEIFRVDKEVLIPAAQCIEITVRQDMYHIDLGRCLSTSKTRKCDNIQVTMFKVGYGYVEMETSCSPTCTQVGTADGSILLGANSSIHRAELSKK